MIFLLNFFPTTTDPDSPCQMSKGCTITETKRIGSFRFHETILRFGEPGSLLACPWKLTS